MSREWAVSELRSLSEMAEAGECASAISEAIGRSIHAVHSKAWQYGIKLAYPTGENFGGTTVPDRYIEAIRVLRESGFLPREISEMFKRKHRVSTGYVKRICSGDKRALTAVLEEPQPRCQGGNKGQADAGQPLPESEPAT